ncbi:MAG: response regulator [Thermodesulfovibrionaceae bacterium]
MITQNDLIRYFFVEAEEHLNTLIEGIEELENKGFNKDTVEALFRATHTLKGSASLVKFEKLVTVAHKLEDLFEALLKGDLKYQESFIYPIKNSVNTLVTLVNEISQTGQEKSEVNKALLESIENIVTKKAVPTEYIEIPTFEVMPILNTVRIDIGLIESILTSLGEVLVQKNTVADKEKQLNDILEEMSKSIKKLLNEINTFSDRYWIMSQEKDQKVIDSFFVDFSDLEFDRYDEYHIFLRKLQEITNDINESLISLFELMNDISYTFKNLGREINFLKDYLLEMRMVPIGRLLHRISESAKDIARKLGKMIDIEIKGSDIKIDKPIFDSLYEPLIHIIRNAIDHGIEKQEERAKLGKPQIGNILIEAKKEGRNIVIRIKDDGKGIDFEKVKEIAIYKGLLNPNQAQSLTKEEILSYIFAPGFSTSEDVDFQSGRGMGLNIVKTAISKLKGTIEVSSELNRETIFTVKIPQSLTVTNLLIFKSRNIEFAIPVGYLEEILYLEDFPQLQTERVIIHKNKTIPVKFFSEFFFSSNGKVLDKGFIIVFNFSGIRKGLVVEEILGHEEATILPLGKFLEGLTQYTGYFISGKGTPRYVIDPLKIFEEEFIFAPVQDKSFEPYIYSGSVLVVDDSISVRKSLQSILENKKIRVFTAKDGVEALNILENKSIDLIITDLEMPIMHGYELISRIRKDLRFKDLPIVVLTSRGTKKHEEKAISLGADGYIVKPFDDNVISEILKRFQILKNNLTTQ